MQKEKKVRAYTRKTKSGKTVSVKAHTAKYDAAEEARKAFAKKAGAGDELVKTKEVVKEKVEDNGLGFTADEYKAWYHWDMVDDPKNPKALKVKKALVASMGPRAYKKYEDQMSESYSSRGDKKAFGALPELVSARTEARNARSFEKLHKGQKALAENLGAKDAAAKFDSMAKEQGAKRKAAEKKLKESDYAEKKQQGKISRMLKSGYNELDLTNSYKKDYPKGKFYVKDDKVYQRDNGGNFTEVTKRKLGAAKYNTLLQLDKASKVRFDGFDSMINTSKQLGKIDEKALDAWSPTKKSSEKKPKMATADKKPKVDYDAFAEKQLKKYRPWKVSKQGSGYALINPKSDPYRPPELLHVSPSFATALKGYQLGKGGKAGRMAIIKSYAATLKKEDKKHNSVEK